MYRLLRVAFAEPHVSVCVRACFVRLRVRVCVYVCGVCLIWLLQLNDPTRRSTSHRGWP